MKKILCICVVVIGTCVAMEDMERRIGRQRLFPAEGLTARRPGETDKEYVRRMLFTDFSANAAKYAPKGKEKGISPKDQKRRRKRYYGPVKGSRGSVLSGR